MSLYVDVHVLQTVPPSCINRDDTGSPKTAVYGGTTRARVSSQAWKHAIRNEFPNIFDASVLGKRTKHIVDLVSDAIEQIRPNEYDAETRRNMAKTAIESSGLKSSKKHEGEVDALFFMSHAQARALAELSINDEQDSKVYKKTLTENPSVDIALFGRMAASDPMLNYDAATQVSHAISTHAIQNEYDYFTAVDDCSPEDNSGAGHLGTVEYNSATLYRYATVNVTELKKGLKDMTATAVCGFVDAFIRTMPTGKQNTFANRTLPDYIYVTIRNDQPINLSGAFEQAVQSQPSGYVHSSIKALFDYAEGIYNNYENTPQKEYVVGLNLSKTAVSLSLPELLRQLELELNQ